MFLEDVIWDDGYEAHKLDVLLSDNPYNPYTHEWHLWNYGWMHASIRKLSEENVKLKQEQKFFFNELIKLKKWILEQS